jgi:hypothetical protein
VWAFRFDSGTATQLLPPASAVFGHASKATATPARVPKKPRRDDCVRSSGWVGDDGAR